LDLPRGSTSIHGIDAKIIHNLIQDAPARFAMLFTVAAGTGMRLGELLSIKIDDANGTSWNRTEKMIHVRKSVYRGALQLPKTAASVRDIDLCEALNAAITEFAAGRVEGFLFTGRTGRPIAPRFVYAHLSGHGAHSFRRWRVSWLRKQQAPEDLIRFWIGHANKTQTDAYSQLKQDVEYRRKIAEEVGLGFTLQTQLCVLTEFRLNLKP
jgi:integrase